MITLWLLIMTIVHTWARTVELIEMCNNLLCEITSNVSVCGIRHEETIVRFKMFKNECALMKYGCAVDDEDVYGLISMEYCGRVLLSKGNDEAVAHKTESVEVLLQNNVNNKPNKERYIKHSDDNETDVIDNKCKFNCDNSIKEEICGIRSDGEGYRVRLFESGCELRKYNCDTTASFSRTDMFICNDTSKRNINDIVNTKIGAAQNKISNIKAINDESISNTTIKAVNSVDAKLKNIIVIDNSMLGQTTDVNETIDNFFAATHVLDLPMKQVDDNELNTRRMRLKIFGPVKVFQPWIVVPKKIKDDRLHLPTLSTCYHKCPTVHSCSRKHIDIGYCLSRNNAWFLWDKIKSNRNRKCPDTYAPVCGVPGIKAREPSIMFQNHCYMDIAQCKMFWENKSDTAITSSYIEASFVFCLGDQLNGLYRFLPLIKTLQHMGRLKKKGFFRYKLRNMKFLNNLIIKEPRLMG